MDKMVLLELVRNEASPLREETLGGKKFLVAPAIMMTEGVWNELYYPAAELEKSVPAWNGRPVCVGHPSTMDGEKVSASASPTTLEENSIGTLFNTSWDGEGKKQKTEVWFDLAKTDSTEKGKAVVNQVREGKMMDVSTGLFIDVVATPGTFNGKSYTGIASNHRPDHLAALPTTKGACSTADGAGVPRTNEQEDKDMPTGMWAMLKGAFAKMVANRDASLDDRRRALRANLEAKHPKQYLYIEDMREESVVYSLEQKNGPSKLLRLSYVVDEKGKVTLGTGVPEEVILVTDYVPVTNESKGVKTMDKAAMIAKLMANGWEESDKPSLELLSEKQLERMLPKTVVEPEKKKEETMVEKTVTAQNEKQPVTTEDFLKSAPDSIRAVLTQGLALHESQKAQLVAALKGNERCKYSEAELKSMSLDNLQKLASLAAVEVSFVGADVTPAPETNEGESLPMPEWDWEKDSIKVSK